MLSTSRLADQPTTIYLCRHGESLWNQAGRAQGQSPDAPGLTELGRAQARLLAERMRRAGVDGLVSSDLRRAVETVAYVGQALDLPPVQDPRWREIHLGQWQGLTRAQVAERWPETRAAVDHGQDLPRGVDGETYAQLAARTMQAIADLARSHEGRTVCVVSHGGNVRAALLNLPGALDGLDPRALPVPNTSVTVLRVANGQAEVVAPPDVSHLDGLATDRLQGNDDESR
ncbi:MAG: histidine phosphatase family protein [Caldilineales bacterium]